MINMFLVSKTKMMSVNIERINGFHTFYDDKRGIYEIIFDLMLGKETRWYYKDKDIFDTDVQYVARELDQWKRYG